MHIIQTMLRPSSVLLLCLVVLLLFGPVVGAQVSPDPENPQGGAIGMQGSISAPPPSEAATIAVPSNGQNFNETPITVSGLCPSDDLIVKLFKNNIFSGSAQCEGGSYSIETDLFNGENELVARVFDELDQPGPDSNVVTVTFEDEGVGTVSRPSLSSNFAKRGANPGQTLEWPIILSGGTGPYAFSVDWGDGTDPDLFSEEFPGNIDIDHVYDSPGVYNIVIKATDANENTAFLQLVGVANGPLSQTDVSDEADDADGLGTMEVRVLWQPAALLIPLILSTFWLGKRYELKQIRNRIENGERPF